MKKIGNATLYCADCKDVLPLLKDIDACVTDPPYGLSFMGKAWDYDVPGTDIWTQVHDVLKPGAHLLSFFGSRTYHRGAIPIEDAGFEIRDQLMWIYGSGFPKSHNIGKAVDKLQGNEREVSGSGKSGGAFHYGSVGEGGFGNTFDGNGVASKEWETTKGNTEWEGWGTALKPAHEPIVMAKKKLEGTNKQNKDKYGTGGINIDGCRIEGEVKRPDTNPDFRDVAKKAMAQGGQDKLNFNQITGAKRKTTVRKSRDGSNVWTDDNSGMKQENNHFADADPRGRYPANVMHGGLQEDWARYYYCPKTSKSERNQGLDDFPTKDKVFNGKSSTPSKDMKGVEQKFTTEPSANVHPTVKPVELMRYLCRLVTPKGGVVLDPFMGSGSTGMAAKDEGFDFIGIEKDEEYYKICESRITRFAPLMDFM